MSSASSSSIPPKQLTALLNNFQNLLVNLNNLLQSTNLSEIYFEFQILILKFQNFKINFKNFVVFPHLLFKNDPDFYPRILLRTKMTQEVEDWVNDCFTPADLITTPHVGLDNNDALKNDDDLAKKPALEPETLTLEEEVEEYEKKVEWTTDLLVELRQEVQSILTVKPHRSVQKKVNKTFDFLGSTTQSP